MIGILGGTFDPIHLGHLHMAQEILEQKGLSEVWFCPAAQSPHKTRVPTDAHHRKKMVELAIAADPAFKLLDWELKREGPSYTIETIRQLKERYPNEQFALLIADELVPTLPKWKEIHEILESTTLYIGQRVCEQVLPATGDPLIDRAALEGYVEMAVLEIRATTIRQRVKEGLDCTPLLPAPVAAYIKEHNLYS